MGNKKDIGTVFKEQLNHLDKSPNENGWNAIEAELDKKKKRRVLIPFWFTYVGLFSAGIVLSWLVYSSGFINEKFKKNDENQFKKEIIYNNKGNKTIQNNENKDAIYDINSNDLEDNLKNNSAITNQSESNVINAINSTQNSYSNTKSVISNNKNKSNSIANYSKKTKSKKNQKNLFVQNSYIINQNTNSTFETELSKDSKLLSENNSIENKVQKTKTDLISEIENENKTILDSINKKKIVHKIVQKDSISKNKENQAKKYFSVFAYGSPTIPVFLKSDSTIDERLNSNSKKSEIKFSYGAYLCYNGKGKLSLRIGVGKNNTKYITQNATINTYNYSNITYSNGYSNAFIFNQSNPSQKMDIIQDIAYIEIPLEAKYKILDKKISFSAIAGINYLFLDKNEVTVLTDKGLTYKIGKTVSLLEQSFGANLGLGIDYKITNNIKINIEPILKYQLRNNQNTNSNPYSLNILTGIEFTVFGGK